MALLFGTFLFSLVSMLPSRHRFYLGHGGSQWTDVVLFIWPVLGTIGCVALLFGKEEELRAIYRVGVIAAYGLLVALFVAMWTIIL